MRASRVLSDLEMFSKLTAPNKHVPANIDILTDEILNNIDTSTRKGRKLFKKIKSQMSRFKESVKIGLSIDNKLGDKIHKLVKKEFSIA